MNRSNRSLLLLGLTGLFAATPLLAQEPEQADSSTNPLFWVNGTAGPVDAHQRFTWARSLLTKHAEVVRPPLRTSFELDGEPFEVEVTSEGVEIRIDGEPIADDRFEAMLLPGSKVPHTVWIQDKDQQNAVAVGLAHDAVTVRFLPRSKKAWLGVDVRPLGAALAGHLDLDAEGHALVVAVRPDSPAARAGLQEHDVLVAIGGEGPVTHERLGEELAARSPGDTLVFELVRRGEQIEVEVELGRAQAAPFGGLPGAAGMGPQNFFSTPQQDVLMFPGSSNQARVWLDAQGRLVRENAADPFTATSPGGLTTAPLDPETGRRAPAASGGDENLATRIERIESTLLQLEKLLERLEKKKKDA